METQEKKRLVLAMQSITKDIAFIDKFLVRLVDDLEGGILLTQIVYWTTPAEDGRSKLRVIYNNKYWIAKTVKEWEIEICLTRRRFDRALKILIDLNLVEKELHKFNSVPTVHIRLTDHYYDVMDKEIKKKQKEINGKDY